MEKFFTKETVIAGVIGLLLGAIISTSSFLVCLKASRQSDGTPQNGLPGISQSAQDGQPSDKGEKSARQNNNQNGGQNGQTPPEMPGGQNGNQNGNPPQPPSNGQQNPGQNSQPQSTAESSLPE